MSRSKTSAKKRVLGRMKAQNRRVPVFAVAKTHRKITHNKFRRQWRTEKMKLKVE